MNSFLEMAFNIDRYIDTYREKQYLVVAFRYARYNY